MKKDEKLTKKQKEFIGCLDILKSNPEYSDEMKKVVADMSHIPVSELVKAFNETIKANSEKWGKWKAHEIEITLISTPNKGEKR